MVSYRTPYSRAQTQVPVSRTQSHFRPCRPNGKPVCTQNRHWLGVFAAGNGLRQRHDLLAAITRLAKGRSLGQDTPDSSCRVTQGRPDRFFKGNCRFLLNTSCFGGQKTGPNPTDRRKTGSKHHLITDANGIPLAHKLTGANRHDVTQALPLVDAIPAIGGKPGRPQKRPDALQGDRAYHSEPLRKILRELGIIPLLASRYTEHGSGLGKTRWVIERCLSWLHQFKRLRQRYERRSDIHDAFLSLGCALICFNVLQNSFC